LTWLFEKLTFWIRQVYDFRVPFSVFDVIHFVSPSCQDCRVNEDGIGKQIAMNKISTSTATHHCVRFCVPDSEHKSGLVIIFDSTTRVGGQQPRVIFDHAML
jgi:hypothetical protein